MCMMCGLPIFFRVDLVYFNLLLGNEVFWNTLYVLFIYFFKNKTSDFVNCDLFKDI